MKQSDLKYLKILARQYRNIPETVTEIVNLKAILSLPKGTEHFISDIHGEYEQFLHVMHNGSGAIRTKIEDEFGNTLSNHEKRVLALLIYYPECEMGLIFKELKEKEDVDDWYRVIINRLVRVCRTASSKYTRSKVRKALPKQFAFIIDELLSGRQNMSNQEAYYNQIIDSVIETGRARDLVIDMCYLVRRFTIDHLHVLGDIYDRGPYPHLIMEELMKHHSIDIQWGNHDVLWMGAAAGSEACIANMLRISARYGNLSILEDSYGINLIPLMRLAQEVYADDPCTCFKVTPAEEDYDPSDLELDTKIHKAISVIQFKCEGQLILNRPEFDMDDRLLFDKMDLENGTIDIDGITYKLKDTYFPTMDPEDPYRLTPQEAEVIAHLRNSFVGSERLQRHIRFLYTKGSMYKVYNGNLLFHGCVPLDDDGSFSKINVYGKEYSGKALYDILEYYARKGYYAIDPVEKKKGEDILWYTWKNKHSPLFGKWKMTTFERYFISDKDSHKEPKNPYYELYEKEEIVDMILREFGLDPKGGHIINGHVPVAVKKGESPAKCSGKLLVIDGGFSRAYQGKTGIAGYTLIYNSYGLVLAEHPPFSSMEETVLNEQDIKSHVVLEEGLPRRKRVADTDNGRELQENVEALEELLAAYRSGEIAEME